VRPGRSSSCPGRGARLLCDRRCLQRRQAACRAYVLCDCGGLQCRQAASGDGDPGQAPIGVLVAFVYVAATRGNLAIAHARHGLLLSVPLWGAHEGEGQTPRAAIRRQNQRSGRRPARRRRAPQSQSTGPARCLVTHDAPSAHNQTGLRILAARPAVPRQYSSSTHSCRQADTNGIGRLSSMRALHG
jgi:hypothetical protein